MPTLTSGNKRERQSDTMSAMKDYAAQPVALAVFLFDLVLWRLQLLDKRRFEVAEQALTAGLHSTQSPT
jgi:hypothetical protein